MMNHSTPPPRRSPSSPAKRKRRRKTPRAPYPLGIERDYTAALKAEVHALFASILQLADGQLEGMLRRGAPVATRTDGLADDLDRLFRPLVLRWGARALQLRPLAEKFARQVDRFSLAGFQRQVKAVAGIDLLAHEPWLKDEVALFTRENVGLVKNVGDTAIARVERVVSEGVQAGESTKAIKAAIQEEMGIAERRAELIAVDQIGKFNGTLSKLRQLDAGVESYTWRTCGDARVRQAHRAREGQAFKWSEPPSDGHPGQPIRCRCHAEPILDMFADLMPAAEPVDWEAIGAPVRRRK